jgi:hypothetical protein
MGRTNPISGSGEDVGRAWRGAALHAEAAADQVGGRLYEEAKCAKQTQSGAGSPDCGLWISDCGLEEVPGGPGAERHSMPGQPPIRSRAESTKRQNAQNKPNRGPEAQIADCGFRIADWKRCRDGRCQVRKVLHAAL